MFDISKAKCRRRESRAAAFNLLLALVTYSTSNYRELCQLILLQLNDNTVHRTPDWEYSPSEYAKSPDTGYVGIVNLGSTCYMSSLLQQLYHMQAFRRGILSLELVNNSSASASASPPLGSSAAAGSVTPASARSSGSGSGKPTVMDKDSVLYQLQQLFGYLQESEMKAYNPATFCHAFKDMDGNPTNVAIQQDSNEFFNLFVDRLQSAIPAPNKLLPNQVFGGVLEYQSVCKGQHRSVRDEPFLTLSLNVKHKRSILDSLDLYVEGERLEGDNAYSCSHCKKKVDTHKRACIKQLPNFLILHLKRFEFSLDNRKNTKIYDECEFPMELYGQTHSLTTSHSLSLTTHCF